MLARKKTMFFIRYSSLHFRCVMFGYDRSRSAIFVGFSSVVAASVLFFDAFGYGLLINHDHHLDI